METQKKPTATAPTTVVEAPKAKEATKGTLMIGAGHEPKKIEEQKTVAAKPALNLEKTKKLVEELHMKIRHRDALEKSIDKLQNLRIEQKEEELEGGSQYQGCAVTFRDDSNQVFVINNPTVISKCVNFLIDAFAEKLIEVEAEITLP